MGINDFPGINPPRPCPVDIGESQRRLYELRNVAALIGGLQKVRGQVTAVIGEASLGSARPSSPRNCESSFSAHCLIEVLHRLGQS